MKPRAIRHTRVRTEAYQLVGRLSAGTLSIRELRNRLRVFILLREPMRPNCGRPNVLNQYNRLGAKVASHAMALEMAIGRSRWN